MTARHVIDRQTVAVVCDSEAAALALGSRVERVNHARWQPAIQRVFDELVPDGWRVVDRLNVDLGAIPAMDFDSLSEHRLTERLRDALVRALSHTAEPAEAAEVELVVHYLRWGALPFWADRRKFRFPDAYSAALEADPAALAAALRRHRAQVVERLVLQLDDERYRATVLLLEPAHGDGVLAAGDRLLAPPAEWLRHAVRSTTLRWLLEAGSGFDRRVSVEQLAARVAVRLPPASLAELVDGLLAERGEAAAASLRSLLADPVVRSRLARLADRGWRDEAATGWSGSELAGQAGRGRGGFEPVEPAHPLLGGGSEPAGQTDPGSVDGLAEAPVGPQPAAPAVPGSASRPHAGLGSDASGLAGLAERVLAALHPGGTELAALRRMLARLPAAVRPAPTVVTEALLAEAARPGGVDAPPGAPVARVLRDVFGDTLPTEVAGLVERHGLAPGEIAASFAPVGVVLERLRALLVAGSGGPVVASLLHELLTSGDPTALEALRSFASDPHLRGRLARSIDPGTVDRIVAALHPEGAALAELRRTLAGLPGSELPPAPVVADAVLAEAARSGVDGDGAVSEMSVLRTIFDGAPPPQVVDLVATAAGAAGWEHVDSSDPAAVVAAVIRLLESGGAVAASLRAALAEPGVKAALAGSLPAGGFDQVVGALWPAASRGMQALRRMLATAPDPHRPDAAALRRAILAEAARSAGDAPPAPEAFGRILAAVLGPAIPTPVVLFLAAEARSGGGNRMTNRDREALGVAVARLGPVLPAAYEGGSDRDSELEEAMADTTSGQARGVAGAPNGDEDAYGTLMEVAGPWADEMRRIADALGHMVEDYDEYDRFLLGFAVEHRGKRPRMEDLAVAFFAWRGRVVGGGSFPAAVLLERLLFFVASHPEDVERLRRREQGLITAYGDTPARSQDSPDGPFHIDNAGLVLLNPFLPRAFEYWETPGQRDGDSEQRVKGPTRPGRIVHLLQWCVAGRLDAPEPQLVLNKILAGVPVETPVPASIDEDDDELDVCEELLVAVLGTWEAIEGTSIDGLQETFLRREGNLLRQPDGWHLHVQRKTVDVLVDQLPWPISVIRFDWMPEPLWVRW